MFFFAGIKKKRRHSHWHEHRRLILVLTGILVCDNVQVVQKPQ